MQLNADPLDVDGRNQSNDQSVKGFLSLLAVQVDGVLELSSLRVELCLLLCPWIKISA
jgi:hypothetical protein